MYELFVFLSLKSNFQHFHAEASNFTTQTKVSPTAALNVHIGYEKVSTVHCSVS